MASTFEVAYINEQNNDLVMIIVQPHLATRPADEINSVVTALQGAAAANGLYGTVLLVWKHGHNVGFIAPPQWHTFLKNIDWNFVKFNVNKKIVV
jgi:hypothetical protein